jgi:hypothetical protein
LHGPVHGPAAVRPQRPLLRRFLMHATKKSNHDCFSFVQRKIQKPELRNASILGVWTFRLRLDAFLQRADFGEKSMKTVRSVSFTDAFVIFGGPFPPDPRTPSWLQT